MRIGQLRIAVLLRTVRRALRKDKETTMHVENTKEDNHSSEGDTHS